MANVYAVKSGNWSDTTVWNTGSLPTSADDVYANGYTVTINTSPTVLSIRNGAASPIVAGGSFVATNGITLTCTGAGVVGSLASVYCFTSNLTIGQSFTIAGIVAASTSTNFTKGAINNSSGTLNVNGNVAAGKNAGYAAVNNSTGTINITGNVNGGVDVNAYGAYNVSSGTINITGNVTGGGNGSAYGAINSSTGVVNITGTVAASSVAPGIVNASTGTMTHIGSVIATNISAIASGSYSQVTYLSGPFIGSAQGVVANNSASWRWIPSVGASYMTAVNSDATGYKNLYTADSTDSNSGQPAASNVRSGTVYGPNSELTGTCAVPAANSVAFGVSVDNTTGTAVLTPESVRSAVGLASANLDSQLSRVANAATTQEVADIVEGAAAQP